MSVKFRKKKKSYVSFIVLRVPRLGAKSVDLDEASVFKLNLFQFWCYITLLHSERPKLYTILAFPSAVGLRIRFSLTKYLGRTMADNFLKSSFSVERLNHSFRIDRNVLTKIVESR